MANPRNAVDFEGIGGEYATFKIDNATITYDASQKNGSAVVGRAVSLSAGGTIALANDGDAVVGKLVSVEADQKATVQTGGYMSLPGGEAATLTLGAKIIGDLGPSNARGYIQAVPAAGGAYDQAAAQAIANGRGQIIDASDAANVVVRL